MIKYINIVYGEVYDHIVFYIVIFIISYREGAHGRARRREQEHEGEGADEADAGEHGLLGLPGGQREVQGGLTHSICNDLVT